MAHVSSRLEDCGLEAGQLTTARLEEYLAYRRACGHVRRFSPRGLAPLLVFLRGLGLAPDATPLPVVTASDRLLVELEEYLRCDRELVGQGDRCCSIQRKRKSRDEWHGLLRGVYLGKDPRRWSTNESR